MADEIPGELRIRFNTPLELKANIEAAIAYFENEQRNAEQQRDWIQKQIEAHQPKRANAE